MLKKSFTFFWLNLLLHFIFLPLFKLYFSSVFESSAFKEINSNVKSIWNKVEMQKNTIYLEIHFHVFIIAKIDYENNKPKIKTAMFYQCHFNLFVQCLGSSSTIISMWAVTAVVWEKFISKSLYRKKHGDIFLILFVQGFMDNAAAAVTI